jgi:hypothetical protein
MRRSTGTSGPKRRDRHDAPRSLQGVFEATGRVNGPDDQVDVLPSALGITMIVTRARQASLRDLEDITLRACRRNAAIVCLV